MPPCAGRRRSHARRVRVVVRTVSALDERRRDAARHVRATSSAICRASPRWASTCSTSRRSTRSAGPTARAATTCSARDRAIPAARMRSAARPAAMTRFTRASARSRISRHCATRPRRQGSSWRSTSPSSARRDHPWLAEHPDWFDWRPDGSLKFAENPPKKYEDIVNVDFYAPDAVPELWVALCRRRAVLGRAGRAHLPRRQPAHEAVAVLGMADRRGARGVSGCDLPRRGVHPAEDDVAARQARLHPVLHLLHLAQHATPSCRNT